MNLKTYKASAKLIEESIDSFDLRVEVLGYDVTAKTATLHVTATLYDKEMIFEKTGTRYCRLYIDGKVHTTLFPFTYYGRQDKPFVIIDKTITYQYDTTFYTDPEVNIKAKIDFTKYYWLQLDDDDPNYSDASGDLSDGYSVECTFTLPKISDSAILTNVPAFTDNENYTIYYNKLKNVTYDKLETGIIFKKFNDADSTAMELVYRDITSTQNASLGDANYTFQLTADELAEIRRVDIYENLLKAKVYIQTTYNGVTQISETDFEDALIVIQEPTADNLVIRDVNSTIVALTGDENVMVKGESMAEFSFTPTVYKEATLKYTKVINGTQTVLDMPNGVIQDVETGTFTIEIQDSRYVTSRTVVEKPLVEYFTPTCYQKVTNKIDGEVGSIIEIEIGGEFFNDSFGAVDNEIAVEMRYTQEDGTMSEWLTLGEEITYNGNRFTLTTQVSGLIYNQSYTFQSRVIDKLYTVITNSDSTTIKPIFDWGAEDFNFNVPIMMNKKTVLRHNTDANNLVLSGIGNRIYLRPNGTDDTEGETTFYPDGSVNFGGDISIKGALFNPGSSLAVDYVIEAGTEEMGTNGTWYWVKWYSGKAECYGTRNFGTMTFYALTSGVPLYQSPEYSQAFPSGLFSSVPEVIDLNLIGGTTVTGEYNGGWIVFGGTNRPSTTNSGSFSVCRFYNTTYVNSPICFHVIGRWKEAE